MHIKVRVTVSARREKVKKIAETLYEIAVREKPEQNAANRRVIALLSVELQVPAKRIRFVSGHKSTSKLFDVRL